MRVLTESVHTLARPLESRVVTVKTRHQLLVEVAHYLQYVLYKMYPDYLLWWNLRKRSGVGGEGIKPQATSHTHNIKIHTTDVSLHHHRTRRPS